MAVKVLIADDMKIMRIALQKILEGNGCEIVGEAGDGKEAVRMYKELHPDMVTLDITMPEMDGINALKKIREHDPAARVMMVSAKGQRQIVIEALKAGAGDFVVKPFKPEQVVKSLGNVMG